MVAKRFTEKLCKENQGIGFGIWQCAPGPLGLRMTAFGAERYVKLLSEAGASVSLS
jgi:hypothetical protein